MQKSLEDGWTCPPKNRPHWLPDDASNSELNYLSWGYRWYGSTPISPSRHGGWHYFVSMEGGHDLLIEGRTIRARPGLVCVTHPDCPIGHADQPEHRCRILTWIWRTPPTHSALHPHKGSFLRMQLSKPQLRHVETLLANCRQAVAVANERSMLELHGMRIQLDLALLEVWEHSGVADGNFRFNLAVEYLRNHLDEQKPVTRLREYLQISEASLKRLFHERVAKSPRAFALDWKMQWAHEQLSTGSQSVKIVAYALGYKHANDFSRAFKRHQGFEASRLQNGTNPPKLQRT